MKHFATYDILSLTIKLEDSLGDVSESEIQMFAYLACILSIFDGNSANDWGYSFIKNELGSPFSEALSSSIHSLIINEGLVAKDEYFISNELSVTRFSLFKELDVYKKRESYIETAYKCLKFIPYSKVRSALFSEPNLKIANNNVNRRLLLDEEGASIQLLYNQFDKLHTALGTNYRSKVIPALVWMSHNIKTQIG